MSTPTTTELLHAFRKLYRAGLHAVQYSKPARYVLRDQLRDAFRDKAGRFDAEAVRRTVRFVRAAGREKGMEHRILRNLLRVEYHRNRDTSIKSYKALVQASQAKKPDPTVMPQPYAHYDKTIEMLNRTMGLCLR